MHCKSTSVTQIQACLQWSAAHRDVLQPWEVIPQFHFQWENTGEALGTWLKVVSVKKLAGKMNVVCVVSTERAYWSHSQRGQDTGLMQVANPCMCTIQLPLQWRLHVRIIYSVLKMFSATKHLLLPSPSAAQHLSTPLSLSSEVWSASTVSTKLENLVFFFFSCILQLTFLEFWECTRTTHLVTRHVLKVFKGFIYCRLLKVTKLLMHIF